MVGWVDYSKIEPKIGASGQKPDLFSLMWQGRQGAQADKQQELANIIKEAEAKYAEPHQKAKAQLEQWKASLYPEESKAKTALQGAQASHFGNLDKYMGPKFELDKMYKQMHMRQMQEEMENPFSRFKGHSNELKRVMDRNFLVDKYGEGSSEVNSFDMLSSGKGRDPQTVKLERAYENALKEYKSNPTPANKKKVNDFQKMLEKSINSPTATTQLYNIDKALSLGEELDLDAATQYAGPWGTIKKWADTLTPGTSKNRENYETQKRLLEIMANEYALGLKIPADKESRKHHHELFNPSGRGMSQKATKEVLKNTINSLIQQAKKTRKNLSLPVYEEEETPEDWSQYKANK
jgi:hypothetical protein